MVTGFSSPLSPGLGCDKTEGGAHGQGHGAAGWAPEGVNQVAFLNVVP